MWLIGFDFGSTTSSVLAATANVLKNCVTGRMEWGTPEVVYRPEPVYTPFVGESLDVAALADQLDRWLADMQLDRRQISGGGAIITGLAALAENAAAVSQLVHQRLEQAIIATADDPCLESWLAFMGNSLATSRAHPGTLVLNLDIGGGTTNPAWGQGGEVQSVGCYYLGARHVRFVPGTYQIERLSSFAAAMFDALQIRRRPGDPLRPDELARILDFYTQMLEAIVLGEWTALEGLCDLVRLHEQVPLRNGAGDRVCAEPLAMPRASQSIVQFSGGVGELIYRLARRDPVPGTTAYGDLGIDLARRIVASPILSREVTTHPPENLGRATVYGMAIHNTELSGSTLFLPRPEQLPLGDLPIVGGFDWPRVSRRNDAAPVRSEELQFLGTSQDPQVPCSPHGRLAALLELAKRSSRGAAIRIQIAGPDACSLKALGEHVAATLIDSQYPTDRPLLLLTPANIGKTLGQYATRWGRLPYNLIVIDEIPERHAQFVSPGRMLNQLVPVSFYGMLGS
jgi:ethanolamine utilization protein EutA